MAVSAAQMRGLTPWKKGQSGNPSGTVKIPEELRFILSLSKKEVNKLISKYARMTHDDLLVYMKNPKSIAVDKAICSIFIQSIEKGDHQKLSFLLDRAIGTVASGIPDTEELDEEEELKKLSMTELLRLVKSNLPDKEQA